ncbi:uncharacterized protein EDB91DRAFT_1245240 [Suillus paluster]|uniref:uncharacterized protein n=1 Tax=Suillus paluster TaxID=48578 RepID=UPI001B87404A|nr:uncharacterized protein EDB91DRAFT_1245240 [Suillus paluster]KAG1747750.1 hypothetical protein EDB91DRAFT_1245240 [Suillus paluster]
MTGPQAQTRGRFAPLSAKVIFTGHPKYGQAYQHNQKKFCNAVSNCITNETGTGVMPLDGMASKILLVLVELLWYTELNAIWHANPSMAAKTHSSKPVHIICLLPAAHPPGVPPAAHPYGDPPVDPQLHQVAPAPAPPPLHLHGLNSPDVEIEDNFTPPSPCDFERSPFDVPLGDALDHLDNNNNNNMMFDGTGTLNSPP